MKSLGISNHASHTEDISSQSLEHTGIENSTHGLSFMDKHLVDHTLDIAKHNEHDFNLKLAHS